MKRIDLATYKRKELFEIFKNREIPFLATTCNVDITNLKRYVDTQGCGFFISISFLITKAVNLVTELRHRIVAGELIEYEKVDPGYTVLLDDETFSFCDSKYIENFEEYREYAAARIKAARECPERNAGDKNHMFFLTSAPWFSFTSIVHPYSSQYGSIPIVTIGKYFHQGDALLIPVGLQAHHGVVDGIHVGRFYTLLSDMCRNPDKPLTYYQPQQGEQTRTKTGKSTPSPYRGAMSPNPVSHAFSPSSRVPPSSTTAPNT